jgi:hypothetical protein
MFSSAMLLRLYHDLLPNIVPSDQAALMIMTKNVDN